MRTAKLAGNVRNEKQTFFKENRLVEINVLDLISRWVHVGTTIVLVGGAFFMRYVLAPAAAPLTHAEHESLRERLMNRWKRIVHLGILLFLLSGFYNYLVVALPQHKGDKLYHPLMGTKIILAFVVFFIGSALVGKSAGLQKIRDKRNTWLAVMVVLAMIIVAIAGFLKMRKWTPPVETPAETRTPVIQSTSFIG